MAISVFVDSNNNTVVENENVGIRYHDDQPIAVRVGAVEFVANSAIGLVVTVSTVPVVLPDGELEDLALQYGGWPS